jgi:hypothetical protein
MDWPKQGRESCVDDAFDKGVTQKTPPSSAMIGVGSVFTGNHASPLIDPRCSHQKNTMDTWQQWHTLKIES